MGRLIGAAVLALSLLAGAPVEAAGRSTPFDAGKTRLSLGLGTVREGGDTGITVAAGAAYYVVRGLELGLDASYTFGVTYDRLAVSPGVRYIFHMVPVVKPYVGAFLRRWVVDKLDDFTSVGGRAGAFYVSHGGTFIGGGVVHEIMLDCSGPGCADTYPEVVLSVVF